MFDARHGKVPAAGGFIGLAGGTFVGVAGQLERLGAGADLEGALQRQRLAVEVYSRRGVITPGSPQEVPAVHASRGACQVQIVVIADGRLLASVLGLPGERPSVYAVSMLEVEHCLL